ncbi:MAG: tetratricopeptide repeat protein [bacterium]|nr:tetratricopeptide repeat protein [bacterium]
MTRIQRRYNQPFFSNRRRSRVGPRFLFLYGLLLGGFLVFVSTQFGRLQLAALDAVGLAPTATPFASSYATQGTVLFREGDLEEAAAMYGQAVRQQPDDINYLYEYGRVLLELDRTDEALRIAEDAIAAAPDDPRGYAVKAMGLMWSDPPAAIQAAILGKDVGPNFAPLYAASGVAFYNLQRYEEAIREGRRAIELDPNDAFVHLSSHFALLYIGNYQGAIDAVRRAIELSPNLTVQYFYLALLYSLPQVGEPEMAVAVYNRIIEMEPDNARAYLRLCETFARVEQADFGRAQEYCDQALEIDPNYGSAYRETGRMQYNRRNYEGAIETFETCVRFQENLPVNQQDIECWYLRGLAHFWLDQCQQAWDVLQRASTLAIEQGQPASVMDSIETGLYNITQICDGFQQQTLPTAPPPTSLPPTPIGGGFG